MTAARAVVRVLVCESSRTYAAALKRVLEADGTIEVIAVHPNAEAAIAALPVQQPDLLTMDIDLRGMNGLEAIEQIMSAQPLPILVIAGHSRGGSLASEALAAGALEVITKEGLDLRDPGGVAATAFRRRAKILAGARVISHPRARLKRPGARRLPIARDSREIAGVGIVASTGGPQALAQLLLMLPAGFEPPLLVVQHIASGFTGGLARWLDTSVPLHVRLAVVGEVLAPGVWIAPEGAHLVVDVHGRFALDEQTPPGLHRPSGDVLLRSLAAYGGARTAAVVLSGMGKDGAAGIAAVRAAGGVTIAQDEESSAIYGMPKAAAEHGAELILPLGEIAPALLTLANTKP
jgi:two-component system chemotaxis response regulator CheB